MTAPVDAGLVESQKAAVALQIALAQLGAKSIVAVLKLWSSVPPHRASEVADDFMSQAMVLIMSRRAIARDLAVAYYRLARALRTGTTIPDPRNPDPKTVTMAELRFEFTKSVRQAQSGSDEPVDATPTSDTPDDSSDAQGPSEPDTSDPIPRPTAKEKAEVPDDTVIPIDDFPGVNEEGDTEEAAIDDAAELEIRVVLDTLGVRTLKKKVEAIDHERPAREVDKERDEAHRKAGARQAAAADRITKNGGRGTVSSLMGRDKKVIGYVRVSTTGTPCGWCAMLISRGLILYSSERTATQKTARAGSVKRGEASEGDKYHDNCKCVAIPVYSEADYNKSELYAINRQYEKLWPKVTKHMSGKQAVSAWRRYFRELQKRGDEDTGDAQVA